MPDLDPVEYDPFVDKIDEFRKNHDEQMQALSQVLAALAKCIESLSAPKRIVRDKDGKALGIEPLSNGHADSKH